MSEVVYLHNAINGNDIGFYIQPNKIFKFGQKSFEEFKGQQNIFLYIKQYTGEVFTNKDCKMNWDNKVGAIGNLKDTGQILNRLKTGTPVIICKKNKCWCGLCAPKAAQPEVYKKIMQKYSI